MRKCEKSRNGTKRRRRVEEVEQVGEIARTEERAQGSMPFLYNFCDGHNVFLAFPFKGRIYVHNYWRWKGEIKAFLQRLCHNHVAFEDERAFAVLTF